MNTIDTTIETIRREAVCQLNSAVESNDEASERARLESIHGQVWDTSQLTQDFEVIGFAAPFVAVRRRSTSQKGALIFQHSPRFYFGFVVAG